MNEAIACASCGTAASAGQRFCGSCGAALASTCASCGTSNPPDHRFCGSCGSPLEASPSTLTADDHEAAVSRSRSSPARPRLAAPRPRAAPVAERRLVSILFADLVGFTPFAEERDSEDVRDTLTRYFDLATEVIGRYGGTVEKFIGDAVMAVWGTPTAREDDAERSVRAALELVDAVRTLGPSIQARAGVLTGETAVTLGATNQGMVAGDLVNTAARLQSVAAPSTVLVGESTFRAASGAIAFEPAGEKELKGKAVAVPAWRALRVVAERGGRGRVDSLEAPFVGREVELRLLKELYHSTGRDQRVRHVSIVGTGGIGKSRLAWEFEKYLDGIEERAWWHHGRAPAYGEGITFWSLGEMIRGRAGLAETDDEATTRARITAVVEEHMAGDPDRSWVESALLELLGIPSGVPSDELFGAWRTFFERLAANGTVVLVFQDLHWADSGTLDFIDHLVDWSRGQPIFILSLARPEILEQRPDWGSARRSFTSLFLEPLSEPAMRELLAGLVPGLPERTLAAIVSRSEGVPLYAVETVRMLVASGQVTAAKDGKYTPSGDLTELAVPETLTALIAARLDSLDPADRSLLLDAAVLGQSFTPAGLTAISGGAVDEVERRLNSLSRRELLRQVADPRSPERGQYSFVQALIREVAYNTLAKRDRKVRHLAAARWFESLGEPELVGALAGHYLAARSLASEPAEADALAAQARIALRAAADRASGLGAHRQAIMFYEQALAVTTDDLDEADLRERAGESAGIAAQFDKADEHLLRALEIRKARGERAASARLTALLAHALLSGRRVERAVGLLETAVVDYADLGDDPSRLRLLSQLSRGLYLSNAPARAVELADEVLEAAERIDELFILADTLVTKGSALATLGRRREGLGVIDVGGKLAEANGFGSVALRAHNNSLSNLAEVDPRASFDAAAAGLALARRLGQGGWIHNFAGNLGYAALRTGEWDIGVTELKSALGDTTDPLDRLLLVNNFVDLLAVRGEPYDDLMAELESTVKANPDLANQLFLGECQGYAALTAGRLSDARSALVGLAATDPANASALLGWSARLALWLGDADAAEKDIAGYWLAMAHDGAAAVIHDVILGGVAGLRGDRPVATNAYRDAVGRWRDLRLPIDEALMAVDMVYVLGPQDPAVAEAVARARMTFTELRAGPFLELLDAATTHGPHRMDGVRLHRTGADEGRASASPDLLQAKRTS